MELTDSLDRTAMEGYRTPFYARNRIWVFAALLLLTTWLIFSRAHTYHEPLERDITTYALVAHELIGGKSLYTEVWDHKPPAIHATYALAEVIVGFGRNSIFLMNVTAALMTLVGCYFAGSAIGNRLGGLMAAAIWAIVCGDMGLEANQPNTEVFINALLTSGFAVFLHRRSGTMHVRLTVLAGLLFALASLYKQIAVLPVALLCFAHIATADPRSRKQALADTATIAAVGALIWGLVVGYFTVLGRVDEFIDAVFIYNQAYAGNLASNLARAFNQPALPIESLIALGTLATLTLTGLVIAILRAERRHWFLLVAWLVGAHIAVLLPGQFFAHYYQLWLPPLAIGSAWAIELLLRRGPIKNRAWLRYATPIAVLSALLAIELPSYFLTADTWSFRKYGPIFVEAERVAKRVDALLQPTETFYEWGSETGLYFTSRRHPPTGIFFADPLLTGPLRAELWVRVAAELDRAKPDIIVLEKSVVARTPQAHPVLGWIKQEYRSISKGGMFLVLARKGSRVERSYANKSEQPPA